MAGQEFEVIVTAGTHDIEYKICRRPRNDKLFHDKVRRLIIIIHIWKAAAHNTITI